MYFVTKIIVKRLRACDSKENLKRKTIKNENRWLLDSGKQEAAFTKLMSAPRIIRQKGEAKARFWTAKKNSCLLLLQKRKTLWAEKIRPMKIPKNDANLELINNKNCKIN